MIDNPVVPGKDDASTTPWYALAPEEVAKRFDVDPDNGLSAAKPLSY